jgi:signal transduction histidine kinase
MSTPTPHPHDRHEYLRTRLMTVFVVMTLAPLVLGAIISLVTSISLTQYGIRQDQEQTAATVGNLLELQWHHTLDDLRALSNVLGHLPQAEQRLALMQAGCPACMAVGWVDAGGQVQWADAASRSDTLDSAARAVLVHGQERIDPDTRLTNGTATLFIGMPVRNPTTVQGALVVLLDLQQFGYPLLTAMQTAHQGYSYVVDATGQLIMAPASNQASLLHDLHALPVVAAALQGQDWEPPHSYAYAGLLQPRVVGIFHPMVSTGWYVVTEAPLAITNSDTWYLFALQALLLIVTGIGALVLSYRLAATITRPLERLQESATQLQQGAWTQPLVVRRNDEVGQLATTFNAMAQELHDERAALVARGEELVFANRELQRSLDSAHAANVLKSQFVATMSHELRTPLTGILGFTDMLELGMYGALTDEQQKALRYISTNGHQLLELINDVLDFSKLEADKVELYEEAVALKDLLAGVVSTCTPQATGKQLYLRSQIDDSLPSVIRSDSRRLRQVLLNLVANALKFTTTGGVTVHVRHSMTVAELNQRAAGRAIHDSSAYQTSSSDHWQIVVMDTGIGIAAEHQAVIFDEFRQVEGSYARSRGGSGLGLAITQRLVTLMGGTIAVSSALGLGSTFTVTLPLKCELAVSIDKEAWEANDVSNNSRS